jgi:predicted membrane-bound spermidine synthase
MLSATLLALELVWTRIFSAEFFYTYAFLVLSLAIMGLGLGALTLRLFPGLGRPHLFGIVLSLTGCTALAGPPLVFLLGLKFSALFDVWAMVGKLVLTILLLSSAYFFGGIALAALFRRNHEDMPRMYMADLLGAAAGVVLAIVLMNWVGTLAATCLAAVPVLFAGLLATRGFVRVLPLVLLVAPFVLMIYADNLLEAKREEPAPVIYRHWDAMAKIKVHEFAEEYRNINIDNVANTPVRAFDGNWDRPDQDKFEFGIDVTNLINRFDSCTFLSLGAGGGGDVMQALQAGATEIHAVEVIPHINELMLTGELAEFTGHIYDDHRVRVVTEDARAYVRRHKSRFDLIYSLSSNSWAALASGSFALAENYLFTSEAYRDYWEALTDNGFMMMEHQFYMPRLVSALIEGLEAAGVEDPKAHFAIYDLPRMRRNMMLLSRQPLTSEIINNAFGELTSENFDDIHLLYPAPESVQDNLISRIVLEGWKDVAESASVNISPATDDRPFVGQMGLWRNFTWEKPPKLFGLGVYGYPISQLIVVIILLVAIVLVVPLNLLPYLFKGPRLRVAPWLYFMAIGSSFMVVEVVLIQKYALFVGSSIYSIAAILLTLLIASGIGSRFSAKIDSRVAFGGIVLWLLLEAFVLTFVTQSLGHLEMGPRVVLTALLVAPLGFFMGMPFPKGALRVGQLVDWGLAVNGVASVLGGAGVVLIAMTSGFRAALLTAALLYVFAYLLISRPAVSWTQPQSPGNLPGRPEPESLPHETLPDSPASPRF